MLLNKISGFIRVAVLWFGTGRSKRREMSSCVKEKGLISAIKGNDERQGQAVEQGSRVEWTHWKKQAAQVS